MKSKFDQLEMLMITSSSRPPIGDIRLLPPIYTTLYAITTSTSYIHTLCCTYPIHIKKTYPIHIKKNLTSMCTRHVIFPYMHTHQTGYSDVHTYTTQDISIHAYTTHAIYMCVHSNACHTLTLCPRRGANDNANLHGVAAHIQQRHPR